MKEVIYRIRLDVISETNGALGGSLIYYVSLCKIVALLSRE